MALPTPHQAPATLSYEREPAPKENFRILGLIVGACFGIVAGIVAGMWVVGTIAHFATTRSGGRMAYRVAGVCFLIASFACALMVVELRRKEVWFLRGFLVGAATLFLLFGLIFFTGK